MALAQLGAAQIGTDPLASPWPALARLLARLRLVWLGPPWATTLQSFLPTPPLAPKTCPQQIPMHPTPSAVFVDSSAKSITFHENYAGEKIQVSGEITLVRKLKLAQVWGSVGLSGDRSGPPGAFSARLELAKLGLPRLGLAWCSLARFRQAWLCSPRLSLPDPRCIFSFIYAGLSTVFWTPSYIVTSRSPTANCALTQLAHSQIKKPRTRA